ncbi:hypothetical protein ACJJTC_010155 [Scirpophaga incertulas]
MRKLLLLSLLLYNIIALATKTNAFDYEDVDGSKRHAFIDDRRNWRKKALLGAGSSDLDHKDYDRKVRHDYDLRRYYDNPEAKLLSEIERQRETDLFNYRKRSEVINKPVSPKSEELEHPAIYAEEKKLIIPLSCERPHERFESCFAGCASITCDNPRERLRPCYPFCEPGCICQPPYVRDDRTHKCVLPDDCTRGLKGIPDLGDDV